MGNNGIRCRLPISDTSKLCVTTYFCPMIAPFLIPLRFRRRRLQIARPGNVGSVRRASGVARADAVVGRVPPGEGLVSIDLKSAAVGGQRQVDALNFRLVIPRGPTGCAVRLVGHRVAFRVVAGLAVVAGVFAKEIRAPAKPSDYPRHYHRRKQPPSKTLLLHTCLHRAEELRTGWDKSLQV